MIVTTADYKANKAGQDGLFTVCSQECGQKMKTALAKEKDTFKEFSDIDRLNEIILRFSRNKDAL
ncbi:hypothetical protein ACLIBG_02650 [Virgibacillus sp. W0181]|uniref:hypothetical protein n=1 Tax=Virgibacillus sp. W0181 TaxID=3391581 RepID=UPI003F44D554